MLFSIAEDFSKKPGLRFRNQTDNSGEEFREDFLIPAFDLAVSRGEVLEIDLDRTEGYTPSFLEESFGGLVRIKGIEPVKKCLKLSSLETPYLLDDIRRFIEEAGKDHE